MTETQTAVFTDVAKQITARSPDDNLLAVIQVFASKDDPMMGMAIMAKKVFLMLECVVNFVSTSAIPVEPQFRAFLTHTELAAEDAEQLVLLFREFSKGPPSFRGKVAYGNKYKH